MDVAFFENAKKFFDFGQDKTEEILPEKIKNLLNQIETPELLPIIGSMFREINPAWNIEFTDLSGHAYDMDVDQKILFLDSKGLLPNSALSSALFIPQVLVSFIEGFRMVRHVEWLDNALERYHPEAILKIGRICMADSIAQTIYVAWYLRECDNDLLWKHLLCGPYSDMVQCFDRVIERCFNQNIEESDAIIEALSLTFRTWFTDDIRVCACDHDSLNVVDDLMGQGLTMGQKQINKTTIICLTHQLGGEITYLNREIIHDILRNPFYGEVQNKVNHTHLSQILRDNMAFDVAGIPFRDADLAHRFLVNQ